VVYLSQRKYEKAVADFSQAILLAPAFQDSYFQRGNAYLRMADYERAVADYDHYIDQSPSDATAYNQRCWSYFKMGKYEEALPDCEKSLELDPDDANTLDSRARVYQALGRTEEATADFKRIIELGTHPELSRQAEEELRKLNPLQEIRLQISPPQPGTNLAYRTSVTVSSALPGNPASMAADGKRDNWWGAGAFAPQWIELDLWANQVIAEVRLLPSQSPAGKTIHRLLAKGPATDDQYVLLHTFEGWTGDNNWLIFKLPEPLHGIRYIRIETMSSPSWVSWREIEVIAGE
jgi:tetratricopeptide (TPR) repeat protein